MRPDDQHSISLTGRDIMLLSAGLKAYLQAFDAHRSEPAGASHTQMEWAALQNDVGRLLWRLEETAAGLEAKVEHSPEAVDPQ